MKSILLSLFLMVVSTSLIAQEEISTKTILETNFLIEVEPSYGFQTSYQRSVFKAGSFYGFYAGLSELYLRTNESVEEEGSTGNTNANILSGLVTGELKFLRKKNLYLNASVYLGWGFRSTQVRLQYPTYNIDRKYEESYHFVSTGIAARIGYRINGKWGIQFFAQEDFSRMIDQYRAILGEKPGFIYGFGGTFSW